MTATSTLLGLAGAVLTTHMAGRVPASQAPPYAVLHPAPAGGSDRHLDGRAATLTRVFRLMVVANDAWAAAIHADDMRAALDGAEWEVRLVSSPLPDRSDPEQATEWSSTLEIVHHT